MAHAPRRPHLTLPVVLAILGGFALMLGAFAFVRLLPQGPAERAAVPPGTPHLVFAEFGITEDRLYIAPATALEEREEIGVVRHAPGWGINPSITMWGDLFAYTVLPVTSEARRDAPAELWLMDAGTRDSTRLARDADLLIAPIFVDGGTGLIYRRSGGEQQELVRVDLRAMTRKVIHAERSAFGMFPIGAAEDGALLFARLSTAGTDVFTVRATQAPALLFHASDHIARDWRISPDGQWLSYLAPEPHGERVVHRTFVVSLRGGQPRDLPAVRAEAEQFGPLWSPDGRSLVAGQDAPLGAAPALVLGLDGTVGTLPGPDQGFDVPVAWSADGRYLAARWFDGTSSARAGMERTVVIDLEGGRYAVPAQREVIIIGWVARA